MEVQVKVIKKTENNLPAYETSGSSGMDVRANITEPLTLKAGERKLIPTGLFFEIPEGYEIQVRPRSGLALKRGLTVLNTPGTVDESYRGEVGIILINLSQEDQIIEPGERIAQLVLAKVEKMVLTEIEKFSNTTERGEGGFGHTGTK